MRLKLPSLYSTSCLTTCQLVLPHLMTAPLTSPVSPCVLLTCLFRVEMSENIPLAQLFVLYPPLEKYILSIFLVTLLVACINPWSCRCGSNSIIDHFSLPGSCHRPQLQHGAASPPCHLDLFYLPTHSVSRLS